MLACSYYIIVLFLSIPLTCQERNTTDVADIRDENHKALKYVAFLLFTIFLLYGIISNILLAIVFYRRQDNHYNLEFILIASQLIICNFIAFLPQVIVVLPEMLQAKNSLYAEQTIWINQTFSAFNNFSLFAILHFSFLVTLNRFVVLILPKYSALFKSAWLYFVIIFVWLSTLVNSTVDFYYCIRSFRVSNLSWIRVCTKQPNTIFMSIHYLWLLFLPIAMFVMYIIIFCSIRRIRYFALDILNNQDNTAVSIKRRVNKARNGVYERSMLIQAALTCGVLEIRPIIFYFLPPIVIKIFGKGANIPLGIFINCYIIFFYAALPTVHFFCNRRARNILKYQFLQSKIEIKK
ncbi:hypothetical protein LOAG_11992 [Loa loa]|uniref:G-protein coupled receptors family 1 profile domain-containing protein n=1 Tax=Loa loa TaxID=7209 RepID=A0A1S0TM17_LOALO|nr:hypothetical protein LOAG_11992 [Loa loa]EFO16515.1 hypothetical protein LOAG_11992 [Loa loa]